MTDSTKSITWHEDWDDDNNSIWEGASPYHNGGSTIYWRLKQRLVDNDVEWYAAHDDELGSWDVFDSLEHAKSECQKAHDQIIVTESRLRQRPENGAPGDCVATEQANAHLIASAPRLLAFAESFVREWEARWVDPDEASHEWAELYAAAKAVIRQASGEHVAAEADSEPTLNSRAG